MKRLMKLMTTIVFMAVPLAMRAEIIAYSPSRPGQPLIFQFNSLQLSEFSAVTWAEMQNTLLIQSTYSNHLQELNYRDCCGKWNIWVEAVGQMLHQDGDCEQYGYRDVTGGFTLGTDKCFKDFLFGGAFSYTNSHLNWDQCAGNSLINSYYGGLYGRWDNKLMYVNTSLIGAFSMYDTTRHFPHRKTCRNANSKHTGGELLAGVESGVIFRVLRGMYLIPFASVNYVYSEQKSYSETGAGSTNLRVCGHKDQFIQTQAGIEFARSYHFGEWVINRNLTLSYVNQTPLTRRCLDVTVISLCHDFTVNGWSFERNLGEVSLTLDFFKRNGAPSFAIAYDGQYGGNYWTQTASLMFNVRL